VVDDEPFVIRTLFCFCAGLQTAGTAGIFAGRIAPPRESKGAAVSLMHSNNDVTSLQFTKSSKNCIMGE
jgi:hypothetical protein